MQAENGIAAGVANMMETKEGEMQNGYKPPRPGIHMGAQQSMNKGTGGMHHPISKTLPGGAQAPSVMTSFHPQVRTAMMRGLVQPGQAASFVRPLPNLPAPTPIRQPVEWANDRLALRNLPGMARSGVSGAGAPGAGVLAAMMAARGGA